LCNQLRLSRIEFKEPEGELELGQTEWMGLADNMLDLGKFLLIFQIK
jgi:hypothetical protein